MMILTMIIEILAAVGAGVLAGNGAVYGFNHIPADWFTPNGRDPAEDVMSRDRQRIPSYPWKYILTASFIVVYIFMAVRGWKYAIPAAIAVWLLFELAVACGKYRVTPVQLTVLLAVTGFGFIPYHSTWRMIIWGALIGGGAMLIVWLIIKFAAHRDTTTAVWDRVSGFTAGAGSKPGRHDPITDPNDIALCASIGMILGPYGTAAVMIAGVFVSLIVSAGFRISKKTMKGDMQPLGTYICAAAIVYIVLHIRTFGF